MLAAPPNILSMLAADAAQKGPLRSEAERAPFKGNGYASAATAAS